MPTRPDYEVVILLRNRRTDDIDVVHVPAAVVYGHDVENLRRGVDPVVTIRSVGDPADRRHSLQVAGYSSYDALRKAMGRARAFVADLRETSGG